MTVDLAELGQLVKPLEVLHGRIDRELDRILVGDQKEQLKEMRARFDRGGALLPGVTVTIREMDTGYERVTVTSKDELGAMAGDFNQMIDGLHEMAQVRQDQEDGVLGHAVRVRLGGPHDPHAPGARSIPIDVLRAGTEFPDDAQPSGVLDHRASNAVSRRDEDRVQSGSDVC